MGTKKLGLARTILENNNGGEPVIIPIRLARKSINGIDVKFQSIPCRDFDTGAMISPYPMDKVRVFDEECPVADRVNDLISYMTPRIHVVGRDLNSAADFCDLEFFELYESMFPWEERIPREQILRILFNRVAREPISVTLPVRSMFGRRKSIDYTLNEESIVTVLTLNNRAIGFMWVSYYPRTKLFFGNYLAVHRCWRSEGMAQALLTSFISRINEDPYYRGYNGIIFEVETIDFNRLEHIISAAESSTERIILDEDAQVIRRFLRLVLYERNGCHLFVDQSGTPLKYFQPCLDIEKSPSEWPKGEGLLWLMFHPLSQHAREFTRAPLPWPDLINFIVMEVEAECYAADSPEIGAKFLEYARSVRDRSIADSKNKNITLGRLIKSDQMSKLYSRWRKLGIKIDL